MILILALSFLAALGMGAFIKAGDTEDDVTWY